MPRNKCDLHRYVRRKGTRKATSSSVFACQDCTHYLIPDFIVGKKARCFYCNEPFVIKPKDKVLKFLHCLSCTKPKNRGEANALKSLVDSLGFGTNKEDQFVGED